MVTKELLQAELDKIPNEYLEEFYILLQQFVQTKTAEPSLQKTTDLEDTSSMALSQRLHNLRQQVVESGIPLLNEAQLGTELASRRGGVES
ncbi:MAG: hypothetical protein AAGD25_25325 [Cyanobacteria bacterium P01_F01_bin.150]